METIPDNIQYFEADEDDVRQEMALLKLEGKQPNKALVRAKLNHERMQVPSFWEDPEDGSLAFQGDPAPSFESIERLVLWATEKGPEAQKLIREFMDQPDNVYDIIKKMVHVGLLDKGAAKPPPSTQENFTELLRRQFRKYGTLDAEQLQEITNREMAQSPRPADNLYQSLKLLVTEGTITKVSNGVYKCTETN